MKNCPLATRKRKSSVSSSPFTKINTGSNSFIVILAMSAIVVAVGVIVWYFYVLNGGQTDFSISDSFYQEAQDATKTAFAIGDSASFTSGSLSSCIQEPNLYDDFSYNTFAASVYRNVMLAPDKWDTNATRYSSVNAIDKSLILNSARRDTKSWAQAAAIMKKATSGNFKLTVDLASFETRKDFAMLQLQVWPTNQPEISYQYDVQQFPNGSRTLRSIALLKWDSSKGTGLFLTKEGSEITQRFKARIAGQNKPAQLTLEYTESTGTLVATYKEANGDTAIVGKVLLDKKTSFRISFANVLSTGATHEIGHEAVLKNIKYIGCFAN